MDRRLIVLETRFDTILPTLATKADLIGLKGELKAEINDLRAEVRVFHGETKSAMHAMDNGIRADALARHAELKAEMHKWTAATVITIFVGFGSMFFAMSMLLRHA